VTDRLTEISAYRARSRPRVFGLPWPVVVAAIVIGTIGLAGLIAFKTVGIEHVIDTVGYPGLFLIIFAETGLLIGFFLPGDSLLITVGLLCQRGFLQVQGEDGIFFVVPALIVAAVLGDATGYAIGRRAGPRLLVRKDARWFKQEHLDRTREFYDRHGGKTIILARFAPFLRTFAPTVAGAAAMPYRRFAVYNVTGGVLWIASMTLLGYFLGSSLPSESAIEALIVLVIAISLAPAGVGLVRERRKSRERR
jgi:membrane-associated protein